MNYIIETKLDIEINNLNDLPKLRKLMEATNMKPNYSKIARECNIKDPRTVKRYYNGDIPDKTTRSKKSLLDGHKDKILELLSQEAPNIFHYKDCLCKYLNDTGIVKVKPSTFRSWVLKNDDVNSAFKNQYNVKRIGTANSKSMEYNSSKSNTRNEQKPGHQTQLDWKEDLKLLLKDGTTLHFNIGVLLFSYSRYRYAFFTLDKKQDVLLDFIANAFESYGGVTTQIICDNMKTIMDKSRTKHSEGVKNAKILEFEKDFGTTFMPCIAYEPWSKGKVESSMKIYDEIYAYNGELTITESIQTIEKIVNRANTSINQGTNNIPILDFKLEKEKAPIPLPRESVLNSYKITYATALVNKSGFFSYKSCQYSVPLELSSKYIQFRVIDNMLHIYYNGKNICLHKITTFKINYLEEHRQLADKINDNWATIKDIDSNSTPTSCDSTSHISNIDILGEHYGS